jgi:predicted alpha/beta superfamily hydrolase
VLYALDGQFMFDPTRSPTGKVLGLDVAADGVATVHSFICVAIDSTFQRTNEYGPSYDPTYPGGGHLADFAAWLLGELKPEIDRVYRTLPGPETTGILGYELGGLAAFRLAWDHPDQVRLVGSMSPLMGWKSEETKGIVYSAASRPPLRVWLDVGTSEPMTLIGYERGVDSAMVGLGFAGMSYSYTEVPGGTADETSWGARLPTVLAWLFP